MKSVIQEGSTLAKAIEQGWIKAGKPREFTIKIFQEAKKNFLGITTIAAKVGIFFKESGQQESPNVRPERKHQPKQRMQPYRQRKFHNKEKVYNKPNNKNKVEE